MFWDTVYVSSVLTDTKSISTQNSDTNNNMSSLIGAKNDDTDVMSAQIGRGLIPTQLQIPSFQPSVFASQQQTPQQVPNTPQMMPTSPQQVPASPQQVPASPQHLPASPEQMSIMSPQPQEQTQTLPSYHTVFPQYTCKYLMISNW